MSERWTTPEESDEILQDPDFMESIRKGDEEILNGITYSHDVILRLIRGNR